MPLHGFWSSNRWITVAVLVVLAAYTLIAVFNLELLNRNSGTITVIFSGFVAMATVAYAILTWNLVSETKKMREVQTEYATLTGQLVSETKKMREAQTEPDMSISLQQGGRYGNLLEMVIQNIGAGEALDVYFETNTDFIIQHGSKKYQKRLRDLNIIRNKLSRVAPNQSYSFFVAPAEKVLNQPSFEIKVCYKNSSGMSLPDKVYTIDFSKFTDIDQITVPLEKIAENIGKLRSL
jgi:hypothetical protein